MAVQLSVTARNNRLDSIETTIGASAILRIRTGAPPATCATADSGTAVATANLPSDYFSAASAGSKALLGTWQDTSADATGTAAHFRLYDSAGTTCHLQGTCGQQVVIPTSALTAANGNVLTFTATTGVAVGMNVSGAGIPSGTTVASFTGTTVTLTMTSTAGVASGVSVTFTYDMTVDNAAFVTGQSFSVTAFTITDANA